MARLDVTSVLEHMRYHIEDSRFVREPMPPLSSRPVFLIGPYRGTGAASGARSGIGRRLGEESNTSEAKRWPSVR